MKLQQVERDEPYWQMHPERQLATCDIAQRLSTCMRTRERALGRT